MSPSLLLYLINGEVINLNIKSNDEIVPYPIPNQKDLNLSQYTADSNVFVITGKSIVKILNFFKQYEIATGAATINISKAMNTPWANAKIYNLEKKIKNVQINNPKSFAKILDIYFTNDLQKTST